MEPTIFEPRLKFKPRLKFFKFALKVRNRIKSLTKSIKQIRGEVLTDFFRSDLLLKKYLLKCGTEKDKNLKFSGNIFIRMDPG